MGDRHRYRAEWHDYRSGVYFVTVCARDKRFYFGDIDDGQMIMTEIGEIVRRCVESIPCHHPGVEVWNYVVMPNHVHIVLYLPPEQPNIQVGTRYIASGDAEVNSMKTTKLGCLRPSRHGETCKDYHHNSRLSVVVGSFKAAVSREVKRIICDNTQEISRLARTRYIASVQVDGVWHSRFYERIIRNRLAFERIMAYVDNNVANWNTDRLYVTPQVG